MAEMIEAAGAEVVPGFSFYATPGHSADHASIVLVSAGARAIFAGDVVHHPIQVHQPTLLSVFDPERERSLRSRRWALDFAADYYAMVFSSHFPAPSAGRVTRIGEAYRWRFA
jgi:glyoxylase-like metal-dependent hydrolase (beta-lactamase superfamily II)